MSLQLSMGTEPANLEVRVHDFGTGGKTVVCIGAYELSLNDFLALAEYALINTDLAPGGEDPRIRFVNRVASMKRAPGWNPRYEHLEFQT